MKGSLRLLRSSHVRSRDTGRLRGILSGVRGCGTDFFSNEFEEKLFLVSSVVKLMGMVISFWECSYPSLWSKFVNFQSITILVQRDKSNWPRCLLWHGWLPALAYPGSRSTLG